MKGVINWKVWIGMLIAVQVVLLSIGVYYYQINFDDGMLMVSSKLVSEGNVPYRDFFFHQTPYSLYIYSPLSSSILAMKSLSILFIAVSTFLLYLIASKIYDRRTGLTASLLFAVSYPVLIDATSIKYYSLVFMLIGMVILFRKHYFWAGIMLGAIAGIRQNFAMLFIPYLLWMVICGSKRQAWKPVAGFIIALSPLAYFLVAAPEQFYFGTIGQTLTRLQPDESTLIPSLQNIFIMKTGYGIIPITSTIVLYTLFAIWFIRNKIKNLKTSEWLIVGFIATIFASQLPLSPNYASYYTPIMPLMAILAANVLKSRKMIAIILIVSMITTIAFLGFFVNAGIEKNYDTEWKQYWKVKEVSDYLKGQNGTVISWDAVYLIESDREFDINYTYGYFAWYDVKDMPTEFVGKHRLVNNEIVVKDIEERKADIYITVPWTPGFLMRLLEENYVLEKRIGDVKIWK